MEPNRVSIIAEWPEPTTFLEIHVLLGLANFDRQFLIGFSRIVGKLTVKLKGETQGKFNGVPFIFTLEAKAFSLNLCKALQLRCPIITTL